MFECPPTAGHIPGTWLFGINCLFHQLGLEYCCCWSCNANLSEKDSWAIDYKTQPFWQPPHRIQPLVLWAVVTRDRNYVIDHSQIWKYASFALRNVEYLVKQDENYHLCHLGERALPERGWVGTLSNILSNISDWEQQAELQHFCLWNIMREAEGCGFVHTSF